MLAGGSFFARGRIGIALEDETDYGGYEGVLLREEPLIGELDADLEARAEATTWKLTPRAYM
jgi:tRNA G37 N-methylase TrmD